MQTRRRTFALTSIGIFLIAQSCPGEGSKPIVDVRFDAPYRQIGNSTGDNWTPTWGSDDALYTGCDDGGSFGGIPENAIAFGKLEGSDPYHLRGTTINGMRAFHEGQLFQLIDGYTAGASTYKLAQCGDASTQPASVCLTSSAGPRWLFASQKFNVPSFVTIDENAARMAFGADAGEQIFVVSHAGLIDGEDQYFIGRVSKSKLSDGNGADWSFWDQDGSWIRSPDGATPKTNYRFVDSNGSNWKITNTYSVDGALYAFITRLQDFEHSGDSQGRLITKNATIIRSTDQGHTWTRAAEENRRPMFPGQRFGAPYFIWYGKDGVAHIDNADKYVYAISNDGFWESGDHYVVGRVPREKLPALSAADWSFYRSGDGMKDGNWASDITLATPVLSDPEQAGMTGVTYIEGLGRYVMVTWHYPSHGVRDVDKHGDTYTVLEFFEASRPWGPWTLFKTFTTEGLAWYTPIIGQRFQSKINQSTVSAIIYLSSLDFHTKKDYFKNYKLNYIPITLSTAPLKHNDPNFVGGR